MKRRTFLSLPALPLLGGAFSAHGQARSSLIRFICPFTPGALHDLLTRTLAESVGKTTGRQTIVENRPGAGGLVGTRALQNAPNDGSTTLLQTYTGFVSLPIFQLAAKYDPIKDFAPVACFATGATVLMVNGSVPVNSVEQLIAYAKTVPAGLEAPTSGPGGWSDIWTSIFAKRAGINLLRVPYKGASEMAIALQTGEAKVMLSVYNEAFNGQVKSGKLKLLAVTSEQRSPHFPDVPTLSETLPGFSIEGGWFGLQAQLTVPAAEIAAIGAAVRTATLDPVVREKFAALYAEPRFQDPAEFTRSMLKTTATWKKAAEELNIKPA